MAVLVLASLAIAVAGLVYLHPFSTKPPRRLLVAAASSPTPPQLDGRFSAVYDFATPSLGWALLLQNISTSPEFWVFRTVDGAKHWVQQMTGQCAGPGTSNLTMFDGSHGEIDLCDPLVAYRTADGGSSWAPMTMPSNTYGFVTFGDFVHGWYLGWSYTTSPPQPDRLRSQFLATADGGATWTPLPLPPVPTYVGKNGSINIEFRGPRIGWLGTDSNPATLYSTADGGLSWRAWTLPVTAPVDAEGGTISTRVRLLPGSGVMGVTSDPFGGSRAFVTTDGGLTWRQIASPPGDTTYDDYTFVDESAWWAMRSSALFKSANGGESWKMTTLLLDDWNYSPHPFDARHAWATLSGSVTIFPPGRPGNSGFLSPGGALAMTSDGGLHWTYVQVPQPRLS